jgi:magnesium chelatase family protein
MQPEKRFYMREGINLAKCHSGAVSGVDARTVEIEVCSSSGSPQFTIVGLPDTAVKEAKDRVSTAIANSGFKRPETNITVNLAPADVRKEGPIYDLPIAVCLLAAAGKLKCPDLTEWGMVGELALSGEIRKVRGVLPIVLEMRRIGKKGVLVPVENAGEAAVVNGISVYPMRTLRDAVDFLRNELSVAPVFSDISRLVLSGRDTGDDFADVKGQDFAKQAIEVAVAGGHNLLMIGSPGCGKTMLAKRIPSILPPMSVEEALEVTRIHSVAGTLRKGEPLVVHRPFRAPHHTASAAGLVGGGSHPQPGEVSLAHRGVLFLDEMPEFSRNVLEILRQPLEDGRVAISRVAATCEYPSRFMLVAAMNPCPCGYFGDERHTCRCSRNKRLEYRNRISGPLLDRIDIQIEVTPVSYDMLAQLPTGECSSEIRRRVMQARTIQQERFADDPDVFCNADMRSRDIARYCRLSETVKDSLRRKLTELDLSARAYDRVLKVARTVADLKGREVVTDEDITAAAGWRALDRSYWG